MIALEFARRLLGSKIGLGALLCLAAVIGAKIYGETRWRDGYEAYRLEVDKADARVERSRIKDEIRLKGITDADLCVEYLRSRGLPVSSCEQLRGVSAERPEPGRDGGSGEGRPTRP
ncbi:hypothetical protein [Roseibium album]|uniref:hypothetical protein n=1 Tax=Roseibium album TaxID=311410 RepID=UPI00248FEF09|nr:hypothetical protein [Roseibium album]